MNQEPRPSLSTLRLTCAYSHEHYQEIASQLEKLGEYQRRRQIEEALLTEAHEFTVPGYCYLTSRYTDFSVTLIPGDGSRPASSG